MPQGAYALQDPRFIMEVLSEHTRDHNRGKKFDCYRQRPSLEGYLLVESPLEDQSLAIHLRTWPHEKEFQEKPHGLEAVLDMLSCPLSAKAVYDLPDRQL